MTTAAPAITRPGDIGVACDTQRDLAVRRRPTGHPTWVFFLFSSRLGCLGSLVVSALLTLLLLLVFDVI